MNRKKAIWMTIPFLIIVFGFSIANILTPSKLESKEENRALAQKPVLSEIGAKEYGTAYEKYYTDQFVLRDKLSKLYMLSEINLNKTEVKGYYLEDDWIFQRNKLRLSEADAKTYSDKINKYGKMLKDKGKDVYYASTPQKENVLYSLMPWYSNLDVLVRNTNRFLSGINTGVINTINIRSEFLNSFSQDEIMDFYFKTDNHWNSVGAFEAFKFIMNNVSKNSNINVKIKNSDYTTKIIKGKDFLGIYNRNLYSIYTKNEDIPYVYKKKSNKRDYYLHNGKEFEKVDADKIIAQGINSKEVTYPSAYTSSSIYYKVINNNALINKKILIVRDSYHSAMSWMFEDIFKEVEVVDPRYIKDFNNTSEKLLENTDSDIVLFMFNDLGFVNMIDEL